MARSFFNIKLFSLVVSRKGYAVAATRGRGGGEMKMIMMKKVKGGDDEDESAPKSAWVPGPVAGYYRPENQANQIDAVELRRMLLKTNFTGGH